MDHTFTALARGAAYVTAALGVVYSVAFVAVVEHGARWAQWTAATALTAGGLVAVPVIVAVTSLLGERRDRASLAGVARTIGTIAAVMTSLHGAYDLAALVEPASATAGDISPVDPRGFATFALAGLATLVIATLARADSRFRRWLSAAGLGLGVALVATWLGRLTVLDPTTPWLRTSTAIAALLSPVVYIGFASVFRRAGQRVQVRPLAA